MANEEQLAIFRQGVKAWNKWWEENLRESIDLVEADFTGADLRGVYLGGADLKRADFRQANLREAHLSGANLNRADFMGAHLSGASLRGSDLTGSDLNTANLGAADLTGADLSGANLVRTKLWRARMSSTYLTNLDLSEPIGLETVRHFGPSSISTDTFVRSKGKILEAFLRGCGLSDWEIEAVNLYNPDLNNEEINDIQYRVYDLRASQALQISPLFVSYSHADSPFVDKIGKHLNEKRVRYWRDIHDMKAGRIEKQIDRAIRQNPTVLLVLSEHSLNSDWVEHEVRTARALAKELGHDILCPVALDDSWKSSRWPKRLVEQIMEYNILDFSAWKDDGKFRRLIDGLELFYKGESYGE
jgi:uncharacterized protein YjbI with pentapeptide repeats